MMRIGTLLCSLLLVASAFAQQGSVWDSKASAWASLPTQERPQVEQFASELKQYLGTARTALASNAEILRRAKAAGFVEFTNASQVKPGARLLVNNRDRSEMLIVVGQEPVANGFRMVGAHQDSPHINLKARPVVERNGVALFKTIYYGGIKRYQWANIPMGLAGRIVTADGRTIDVSIGFKPGEPVFVIADNAPHSDRPLRTRPETEALMGEEMDPVAATAPGPQGGTPAAYALSILKSKFNIQEQDLVGAELALVPVSQPADVGLDGALVGAYGQDDRLSSFCAARAAMDIKSTPKYTAIAYMTNFEEVGSGNTTGAQTEDFFTTVEQLIAAQSPKMDLDLARRLALRNSYMISADTNDGVNPIFGELTSESSNAARVGFGVTLKEYGGQFDAPAELNAKLRGLMDANHIPWQTQTPKVDVGGGGTIGGFFSVKDVNVIDLGVPLLSMHSPYEMSSKVDDWYYYKTMAAFLQWNGK